MYSRHYFLEDIRQLGFQVEVEFSADDDVGDRRVQGDACSFLTTPKWGVRCALTIERPLLK